MTKPRQSSGALAWAEAYGAIKACTKIVGAMLVRSVKAKSSKAMNDRGVPFALQEGYGCFSVSTSNVEAVHHHIEHQETYHRTRPFEEEYALRLEKNGIVVEPTSVGS